MNQVLQISIPEKVDLTLKRAAKTTQQPPEQVAADFTKAFQDSLDEFVGSFATGIKDAADQHDKYLGETLAS